jgi:hypothetical protein
MTSRDWRARAGTSFETEKRPVSRRHQTIPDHADPRRTSSVPSVEIFELPDYVGKTLSSCIHWWAKGVLFGLKPFKHDDRCLQPCLTCKVVFTDVGFTSAR